MQLCQRALPGSRGGKKSEKGRFSTLISRPDFLQRIEARARMWGRRAGLTLGEPLAPMDSLAVTDVDALFGGAR